MIKILVLGASGMLGNVVFRELSATTDYSVWGSIRSDSMLQYFPDKLRRRLVAGLDVQNLDSLARLIGKIQPQVVINCVGYIKQLACADDPLVVMPVNARLPHKLAALCEPAGVRVIHISTDCVFSGHKGQYREEDPSDAVDLYGRSKYIGELRDLPHAITLRTSIIGHALNGESALIDWFLAQKKSVIGYSRAIFSGLPTVEFARVLKDFVLPRPGLRGLYHVAADPISKFDLLRLVASQYKKSIDIKADNQVVIDRSLNASRFNNTTGYLPPTWPDLVSLMHRQYYEY